MKVLRVALERQNYELAAHVLVYGLVKAKTMEGTRSNGKKRSTKEQPKR